METELKTEVSFRGTLEVSPNVSRTIREFFEEIPTSVGEVMVVDVKEEEGFLMIEIRNFTFDVWGFPVFEMARFAKNVFGEETTMEYHKGMLRHQLTFRNYRLLPEP